MHPGADVTASSINHVKIALGSQAELETELEIAKRLAFVDAETFERMTTLGNRLRPLLHGLRRSIAQRPGLGEAD